MKRSKNEGPASSVTGSRRTLTEVAGKKKSEGNSAVVLRPAANLKKSSRGEKGGRLKGWKKKKKKTHLFLK